MSKKTKKGKYENVQQPAISNGTNITDNVDPIDKNIPKADDPFSLHLSSKSKDNRKTITTTSLINISKASDKILTLTMGNHNCKLFMKRIHLY